MKTKNIIYKDGYRYEYSDDIFNIDSIYKLFNILLSKEWGVNIVFNMVEVNLIYSIQLAKIAMTDDDYKPIIIKYLNEFIKHKNEIDIIFNDMKDDMFIILEDEGGKDSDISTNMYHKYNDYKDEYKYLHYVGTEYIR